MNSIERRSFMARDRFADVLKGYACLLVIFGHVLIGIRTSGTAVPAFCLPAEKFIWSFHIDLFMFLSGFVYSLTGGSKRSGSAKDFLLSKLAALGIPYIIFSSLYTAVNCLTPGVNNQSSFSDLLTLWYKPVAQYWFIYALFWLFVLWTLLSKFLPNFAVTLILYAVFLFGKCFNISFGFLDSSLNCVLAFGIGTCLTSIRVDKIPPLLRAATAALHIAATFLAIKTGFLGRFLADDLFTVFGIFSSLCFISLVWKIPAVSKFLLYICKYSFPLYLLHTFFTAAARIFLLKLGIANFAVQLCVGTAAGILLPLVCAKIAERSPYLEILFYPKKGYSEIRSRKKAAHLAGRER